MSGSTNKRVRVLRFEREPVDGFVHPQTFQTPAGIEMLTRDGNILALPYSEVKVLCFVQDFDEALPELNNRTFASRPKSSGLWVRMIFRDGAILDGILPNSLLNLEPHGFTVTPPDLAVSPQRVFVPRAALRNIHVLAVVGSGLGRSKKPDERQISIFDN
ncbi:MAG: hypothetical protein HYX27_19025 [Acidobacteria bacterium]|nr:hypothetical protein [Acidobacteriota bacterium]